MKIPGIYEDAEMFAVYARLGRRLRHCTEEQQVGKELANRLVTWLRETLRGTDEVSGD